MSVKIAIIICTERPIERKSLLLVRSIRQFGGAMSKTAIFSFSPRTDAVPSQLVVQQLHSLGVIHQAIPLNTEFPTYALANKPMVCAYAERTISADTLVFMDSDSLVLNEPLRFLLADGEYLAASPVYRKNVGVSTDTGGQNEHYWQSLYQLCDVRIKPPFVSTVVDQKLIYYYINSGLVAAKSREGLFQRWEYNFRRVMQSQLCPSESVYIEQTVLSATILAHNKATAHFPPAYNYPICWHNWLSITRRLSLATVVTLHYHHCFDGGRWRALLPSLSVDDIDSTERYYWLHDNLWHLTV